MKEQEKNILVERFENGLLDEVNKSIARRLGVWADFRVEEKELHGEFYVTLRECGTQTTRQLTATPLLAHMFQDAHIYCQSGYHSKEDIVSIFVKIEYNHPRGGSNGLELGILYFNKRNRETYL